jgi:hypothetical protein
MRDWVKLVECPRDAWQGLPIVIPAEVKADYLRVLIACGFRHLDAVSFVSPAAVPQMADSEMVLDYLDPPDDVEIIGIVVNEKGAERAVKTGAVGTGGSRGGGGGRWGFLIRSRRRFWRRTRGRIRWTRWMLWRRWGRWLTRPGWMWWRMCRWRSGILMGIHGI